MNDSPLLQTFRTLSKPERRELRKWVNSPFFNQRSDVIRLFDYLCAQVPAGAATASSTNLDKSSVFQQVFPPDDRRAARVYSDADMRYTMSFLFQLIKQYLAYAHWAQDEADTGLHLCKSLRHRGLDQIFEKECASLDERLGKAQHQSVHHFYQQYHLQMERWEVFRRTNRGASDALRAAGSVRDAFIAAETMREAAALLAQPGEHKSDEHSIYLKATLDALDAGAFADQPAVMAYYHCYRMLWGKDKTTEEYFQALYELLIRQGQIFPANEIRDLFILAINYCIRRLNSGAREYIRSALELYRWGLELGVILEDGFLNKYTYNNILLLALALEEWEWALHFLEQYRGVLPSRDRDSAWRYNLATYYFRKKDYAKAQDILHQVEFRDVFYNLDARRMLVRIYFDTGEISALDSLLDSFTIYLQRKRASLGYHKDLNLNFVRFVKGLLHLEPGDAATQERLRTKIRAAQYVAEREWLLGKC